MNIEQAKTVITRTHIAALDDSTRASGLYMESGPGIGKSSGVFQATADLAKALGRPVGLVQEMVASYTGPDTRGFMMPVKGAAGGLDTIFSTPAWFPVLENIWVCAPSTQSAAAGVGPSSVTTWHRPGTWKHRIPDIGTVFLDEFAQADDDVKKPMAEVFLNGRIGTKELPLGWRVIAAGNRTSDRSGVMRELMFLVNRRCLLSIDASLPSWIDWANRQMPSHRPHYLTMSFAQKNPDIVFKDHVPEGTDPFCTPRTLCLMDKDLRALRSQQDKDHDRLPLDDISREVAAGWIGKGSGAQFFTHLRYADQLPDIADIERDPAKAKVPENKDAQMVAGYMLAHNVTEANAEQILKYMGRMNIEMQVLTIRAVSAGPNMKAVVVQPGYVQWITKNKELLIASGA